MKVHDHRTGNIAQWMAGPLRFKRNLMDWGLALFAFVVASLAIVQTSWGQGTGSRFLLTMDRVMTPEELSSTGVATLSTSQRSALDRWLNSYTARVLRVGEKQACRDWNSASLESVSDGGEILTTLSGHVFDVDDMDRINTQLWLAPADILYRCDGKDCTIINLDEHGETAEATLLK
jgi:hypothetical protein